MEEKFVSKLLYSLNAQAASQSLDNICAHLIYDINENLFNKWRFIIYFNNMVTTYAVKYIRNK